MYIASEHFTGVILEQIEAPKSVIFHFPVKCSVADDGVKAGDMKKIPLTQGKFALVDDEDFERVNQFKWAAQNEHGHWYAVRVVRMHRFILNAPEAFHVDHVDDDGLNNQGANIRICTPSQNQHNRIKQQGSSKYKGVTKYINGKWRVVVGICGKSTHFGYYEDEREAALVYDRVAVKHFGEFARTNKMLGLL